MVNPCEMLPPVLCLGTHESMKIESVQSTLVVYQA